MDEEAKVRAMAGFDSLAGVDEAVKAMPPRLTIAVDVGFWKRALVSPMVVGIVLIEVVVDLRVVGQKDANDAVSAMLERRQVAGLLEVFTDKFRASHQSRFIPHASVHVDVVGVPLCLLWGDAGAAGVSVWRQEGVNPQFVVHTRCASPRHDVDGFVPRCNVFSVQDGCSTGGDAHAVDELVEVAHEFIVLVNVDVLAQHPVGKGLHELGGLFAVKAGDDGTGQLLEVSDESAFGSISANFDFIKSKSELLT